MAASTHNPAMPRRFLPTDSPSLGHWLLRQVMFVLGITVTVTTCLVLVFNKEICGPP
jgi:hypothetical protein